MRIERRGKILYWRNTGLSLLITRQYSKTKGSAKTDFALPFSLKTKKVKGRFKIKIIEITKSQANRLLESGEKTGKYEPRGLFIRREGDLWIGYDNRDGDCFIEESRDRGLLEKWLKGEIDTDQLYEGRKLYSG